MTGGISIPWPWPWDHSLPQGSLAGSRLQHTADSAASNSASHVETIIKEANALCAKFGEKLPDAKSVELYLIEGIANVTLPAGFSAGTSTHAVIYPPEFLFIIDVGLECLVGGNVFWRATGLGDPDFPENREIHLRSVSVRDQANLIFPKIAGSLMIGIREGTPAEEAKKRLEKQGLQNIKLNGTFVTASCVPFQEATVCKELEAALDFVKYSEANGVVRIVDFSPGWFAKRLV